MSGQFSERMINLAERVLDSITAERLRGMKATTVVVNTDDYATMCLENGGPKTTLWSVPLERSGTVPPTAFIVTSVGPG